MKKILSILLVCCLLIASLAACGNKNEENKPDPTPKPSTGDTGSKDDNGKKDDGKTEEKKEPEGMSGGKFIETRKITVEVYDRGNDGGSKPEDNFYTNFIKEGMLRDYNVEVTFIPVPRWTEDSEINNRLAAGDAPDVCVTYSYPTIQTYAGMGGVLDLGTYVEEYKDLLPNLWNWLGATNIYWDRDPNTGTIWALEAKLAVMNRINTFVREDWLKKLNIPEPTTLEEFEAMLRAFRDNASTLLGADADKMIPFSTSFDVGWRSDHLTASYVPNDITDKDYYIYGFDDRHLLLPGYKEGIRKLNEWYNDNLVWKDFALYGSGDTTEDAMLKAGYVGAFIHNWDYPYRSGEDGINANLKRLVGEDAGFIAVEPFKNDAGVYRKFLSGPVDRKVFFPATNNEPLASLLYLDWISNPENRIFLQIGEEGVTHEKMPDGAIKTLAATGDKIMNSPNNIDYTITCNGLDFGDKDLTVRSIAVGYAGVDARYIQKAFQISPHEGRIGQNVNVGAITAEEGMGPVLKEKRDILLDQAVTAPVDKFDSVYDDGMKDYLSTGGQAIIDERKEAWERTFGDVTALPQ